MNHDATLQHIEHLGAKIARLQECQLDAQLQLIHRVAVDYRTGHTTAQDAYETFREAKAVSPPGFCALWDRHTPHELHSRRIRYTAVLHAPDEDGNWRGTYPFADGTRTPPYGVSVVYVLFDDRAEPCYVGSTAYDSLKRTGADLGGLDATRARHAWHLAVADWSTALKARNTARERAAALGLHTPTPRTDAALARSPLVLLILPAHVHNALTRDGIRTIGDLTGICETDVLDLRGVGAESLRQIITALARNGLALRDRDECCPHITATPTPENP